MNEAAVSITQARAESDIALVKELFVEYAASIGIDLEYQGFSKELAGLPGKYAPPSGDLLLATTNGEAVGCVALRALGPAKLELKRLYVRPSTRGMGLGKRLVEAAISAARQGGYAELRRTPSRPWFPRGLSTALWDSSRFRRMVAPTFQAPSSTLSL